MIVFLIDADNLSMPAWIDEAFDKIKSVEGAISVRRAYGGAEKLKGLEDVMQRHAIRQFLNLSLTKNTTDVALAVDAMELACKTPLPKTIIIGSGDVDFLPLVVRLRERGIKTVCVSARNKMSKEAISAYDQVIYVGLDKATEDQVSSEVVSLSVSIPAVIPAKKVAVKKPAAKKVAVKAVPAKKIPVKKVVAKKGSTTPLVATVAFILESVQSLSDGGWHSLSEVHKPLIDAKLIGKSAASTKVFKKFPHHFELMPEKQPNQVRYIPPPKS
jgi:NYN domain